MKLFVFDIDNTVTSGPSVWEVIHKEVGTWDQGQIFLKEFLTKQISFTEFAEKDVACWEGLSLERLTRIFETVTIRPGFFKFIEYLKQNGVKTAVLSSSLEQFVSFLNVDFDYVIANPLDIKDNKLSGKIDTQLSCFEKGDKFEVVLDYFGVSPAECGGIGDSEYDLPFLEKVSHGFYCGEKLNGTKLTKVSSFFEVKDIIAKVL